LLLVLFVPAQRLEMRVHIPLVLSVLAMFTIGFWDDLRPLGAKRKLALQLLVAVCVHFSGLGVEQFKLPFSGEVIELHAWGVLLTSLWLVGIMNLLYIIVGIDGLESGIGLMMIPVLVS